MVKKLKFNVAEPICFESFLALISGIGVDNIDGHARSFSSFSLVGKADYDKVIRF